MKNNLITAFAVFALIGSLAFANDEHHKDDAKTPVKSAAMENMEHMKGMMHDCMEMHKDGKMCEHNMMESCQKDMKKEDCAKMMKQAKKETKEAKKATK